MARIVLLAGAMAVLLPGLLAASSPGEDGEMAVPLRNWSAPPYWTPPAQAAGEYQSPERDAGRSVSALALPTNPLPFVAVTPCRIVNTRRADFPADFGAPALVALTERTFVLPNGPCAGLPANAGAWSLNITVVPAGIATLGGYLSVYPAGGTRPVVSTLNFLAGATAPPVANAAVVPAGPGGAITVYPSDATHLLIDVNGYYSSQGVVTSLNTIRGEVTLAAGANVVITPSTSTLTIAAAGGGAPSGPAGGSLSGTYPDPTIASGAVGSAQMAAGAVGPTQLANATAVRSINGSAQDQVILQGTGDVSVTTVGSTVTIGPPPGSMVLGAPGDTTLIGAEYSEVARSALQFWTPTAALPVAPGCLGHTAVWTGTRMIVWGGGYSNGNMCSNQGSQYDPVTNSWTEIASGPRARRLHTAVWTGSRMIVFGGRDWPVSPTAWVFLNDGYQYDSLSDTWTAIATEGAPSARAQHTAVWTGSQMVVWGGMSSMSGSALMDGGRYDPVANAWTTTSTSSAPPGRYDHSAVWTGSRMIVWGGTNASSQPLGSGGQYDPVADSWTEVATDGAPSLRFGHTSVWTGSRMLVWGGKTNSLEWNDGARYDPVANEWTPMTLANAPTPRSNHTAVWTATVMIVWGGLGSGAVRGDGGVYDPVSDAWARTTTAPGPSGRSKHTAVWTGSRMVVWGGGEGNVCSGTGGQMGVLSVYAKN